MILNMIMVIENEDNRAFILKLYMELHPLMKATAFEIVNDQNLSEDILQEAIVRLIEKTDMLKTLSKEQITSYTYRTVRNISLNYYRKHLAADRQPLPPDSADDLEDDAETIPDRINRLIEYELLGHAVKKLSERDRDLLYYKYFLELRDKEIAEVMSINEDTIRSYLTRARRRVKKFLTEME